MTPGIPSSPVSLLEETAEHTLLLTSHKRKRHVAVTFSEPASSIVSRQHAVDGEASDPQDQDDTLKSRTWYTEEDFLSFERDVRTTIHIMRSQFASSGQVTPDEQDSADACSNSGSDEESSSPCAPIDQDDLCFRGLEKYETSLIHYNRKQRERAHKAAILQEQERQRQSKHRRNDDDAAACALRRLSRRNSKGACQEARVLASRDATEQLMMRIGGNEEPGRKRAWTDSLDLWPKTPLPGT